jgi:hypothetical protein
LRTRPSGSAIPEVNEKALPGLKLNAALPMPRRLAEATLAARLAGLPHAAIVLGELARVISLLSPVSRKGGAEVGSCRSAVASLVGVVIFAVVSREE